MVSIFKISDMSNIKRMKKYKKITEKINSLETKFKGLSDVQLQNMTKTFKKQLSEGEKLESILPEAFAAVREASRRVLRMRHFDVQLYGGLALAEGNIAEMPTGEGKTLVASLPTYLKALESKGVHVITVNDYLAKRDFEQIGMIHRFLGLSVGLNISGLSSEEKHAAYSADITYGVGTEFGFDYLRDNMSASIRDKVQRLYHYAIIDEVDSVLIDEAKTPLIIAGKMTASAELHHIAAILAERFEEELDFEFDDETKAVSLTDNGIEKVEKAFGVDNLYELNHQTLYHYVIMALRAKVIFKRDVDYIIKDGKILLVDMFTGRTLDGRTLSDGLHQALEAKEELEITDENKAQAQITIQNYFRMYPILSGMTGTAYTQAKEFSEVYGMDVVQIPTNNPLIRSDYPDRVFQRAEEKYKQTALEVAARHKKGQPVLIGTTSIIQSERIASFLKAENLKFQILNAKSIEQEVELISQAGQLNQITVATNMAGRGTDIILGEGAAEIGGLHVIGTEKHESRRIDNQLKGRSGRQGNPGSSQFILSLEDDMFKRFAKEDVDKFNKKIKVDDKGEIKNKEVHELVERTQRIVEGSHFGMREYNLKLDNIINDQREIVYNLRNRVLQRDKIFDIFENIFVEAAQFIVSEELPENGDIEDENIISLEKSLVPLFGDSFTLDPVNKKRKVIDTVVNDKCSELLKGFIPIKKSKEVEHMLASIMLPSIDAMWIKHLEAMSHLKEGIGLRVYQQEDPMRIYQKEGLELFVLHFQNMRHIISNDSLNYLKSIRKEVTH